MTTINASFQVPYRFQVTFTSDVFAPDNDVLAKAMPSVAGRPARCLVYVDDGVSAHVPDLVRRLTAWFALQPGLELVAAVQPVAGGEVAKGDLAIIDRVGQAVHDHRLCRHSYVVIIGGGAVLDAIGLGASLAHRGIRQVRLPTTTLAQGDAGLGVKNGINRYGAKNFLGTFTPPWAIINDLRFLEALDARSWRAGLAEAIKVAVIKDAAFLSDLCALAPRLAARDLTAMEQALTRCAALHLEHICSAGDPFEQGSSRPLDFGHWSAHRLEILSGHKLQHGEAVAIGVALDLCYAVAIGRLTWAETEPILLALTTMGFALWHPTLERRDSGRLAVLAGLEQFREHLGGDLTLAMPAGLGRRADVHDFDHQAFTEAYARLKTWVGAQGEVRKAEGDVRSAQCEVQRPA